MWWFFICNMYVNSIVNANSSMDIDNYEYTTEQMQQIIDNASKSDPVLVMSINYSMMKAKAEEDATELTSDNELYYKFLMFVDALKQRKLIQMEEFFKHLPYDEVEACDLIIFYGSWNELTQLEMGYIPQNVKRQKHNNWLMKNMDSTIIDAINSTAMFNWSDVFNTQNYCGKNIPARIFLQKRKLVRSNIMEIEVAVSMETAKILDMFLYQS